jgi:hypothetical protein
VKDNQPDIPTAVTLELFQVTYANQNREQ